MKNQIRSMEHSVWQALVVLVLAAVLPLLIFGAGVAWMIVDQKKTSIADNLKSTTSALRVAVDHELLGQMRQAEILATDASLDSDNLIAFVASARRVIAANGAWFGAALIDPASHAVVANTAAPVADALNPATSTAVDAVLKSRKPLIVGASPADAVNRQPFMLLMAPVFRGDKLRYVLSVAVRPDALNSLFSEQKLPTTWTGAIIDSRLVLAGRSRDPERYVGVPATPSLAKAISAAQSGLFTAINQEGKTVYTVFDRSTVTGWSVVIGIPAREVEGPIQTVLQQLYVAATVLIAFALLLAWRVGRDIVQRQQVESGLHQDVEEKSAQLETIFALSPDGFVSFDAKHCVNYVSPAFSRLSGVARESVMGLGESEFSRVLADACIPTRRFSGIASMMAVLDGQTGEDQLLVNTIVVGAPGNKVLRVALRKGASDSVSQILHIRDVTHETAVEDLKNEFLATAAHELRTPMASIMGFSEVLLDSSFSEAERQEMIAIIHRQSVVIAKVIDDLLDLSRIEARMGDDFVLKTEDLHDLVMGTLSDFKAPVQRDRPTVAAAPEPILSSVDRGKFQRALTNLLSNAYKYSPEGGAVTIGFSSRVEQGRQMVGVSVTDQGIGMTVEQSGRVFERFYRADTSGKIPGTGLGLNIVKEIVELHHGRVEVHSAIGEGTTVTMWLPRIENGIQGGV